MPKMIVPLTDMRIRKAKPGKKEIKLFDGGGLYLLVTPAGGKLWRFKYRWEDKEKKLSLGAYPEISLVDARGLRDAARKKVVAGIDPGLEKKIRSTIQVPTTEGLDTFEVVAREWFSKFMKDKAKTHQERNESILRRDVFPWLGGRPIGEITAPELLTVLRRVEDRGAVYSARWTRMLCGQIFRYAVATGRADRDVSHDLIGAIPPSQKSNHAAITDPKGAARLMRDIDAYKGSFVVRCALRFSPLVFVRPGELRHAEWSEIDLEGAMWTIPAGKMKMRYDHMVPLSRQALTILNEIMPLTGSGRYVFPGHRSPLVPLSENAVLAALRGMGYTKEQMTGHGFRAMARTILDEVLQVRPDFIEHQLAHAVRDPNGRAYNRTAHLEARRAMMQQWADYLDTLKA